MKNKTIVITRSIDSDTGFSELLENHGATVIHFPTIKIIPVESFSEFDQYINEFEKFDYLIFSSANAVKAFANRISETNAEIDIEKIKIVAVGTATARECENNKLSVDIIPDEFSAEGVLEALKKYDLKNKNIFLPTSVIAREELKELLLDNDAKVYFVPVYNNVIPPEEEIYEPLKLVKQNKPDLFIFTSPSTFNNFVEIMEIKDVQKYFKNTDIAAIGSVTAAAIAEKGVDVNIIPDKFTMDSLVEKIIQYYN